jgi:hypothetical protein
MRISLRMKKLAVEALRMRRILRMIKSLWKNNVDKALRMKIRMLLTTGPCG